jgi:TetR/AcrR family transcriptional regulator, transcriptional repressor for nem operon
MTNAIPAPAAARRPDELEPSRGALTRERIMTSALDLIHERGMHAVSVGDVLRASGTGKSQFYQHFAGRDELVVEVLRRHRSFLERRDAAPLTSWDAVRAWMDSHLADMRHFAYQRGCPVGTPAYALQPDQESERRELKAIFDRMRARLAGFLRTEQRAGRLSADADPAALAAFTVAAVQGGLLLGLVDRGAAPVRAALDEAFAHLRSYTTNI